MTGARGRLHLAPDLTLPVDAITETTAILGIRGSGKTNTAVVIAEELLAQQQQVVIIDPTDAWWGLKSSADGKSQGHPVVVLGGKKADLPLAAGDGKSIADFVCDHRASVVLSLRNFESKAERQRFITDFARRLYFRKGQEDAPTPIMVMIDEASLVVPQRVQADEASMVGAIQTLVRQGRSSGIGVTLIDQRAASVNKDVLTQLELLICHRTTSPQDRKALQAWVEQHDMQSRGKDFLAQLADLKQGTAWFWSPGWLDLFKRVSVRARSTFDSSRTPKAGERIAAPSIAAAVDLDALRAKLGATIEKARADDPAQLRRRIAELESEVRKAFAPTTVARSFEAPIKAAIERTQREDRQAFARQLRPMVATLQQMERQITACGERLRTLVPALEQPAALAPSVPAVSRTPATLPVRAAEIMRANGKPALGGARTDGLPEGELVVLRAIAQYDDGVVREQLSVLTGYKKSSRDTYVARLRSRGYVETPGQRVIATDAGRGILGDSFELLPTGEALRAFWMSRLPDGEGRVLAAIVAAYPRALDRDALTETTGYKKSSRDTYIARLRSRRLITTDASGVRSSDTLFDLSPRGQTS